MWHHRHVGAVVMMVNLACPRLDFLIFFSPRLQVCLFTFVAFRSTEFVADPVGPIVVFMLEVSRTHMGGTPGVAPDPFSRRIANRRA